MSPIDHILLYILLYVLSVLYENKNCSSTRDGIIKKSGNSELLKFLLIFVYLTTEGLRYGRGVDQVGNYGPFYVKWCMIPDSYSQDFERPFVWINQIVHLCDFTLNYLPFGLIFVVFAWLFIIPLLKLHLDYKNCSKYFILLAMTSTLYVTEWTIRQGVGFAFLLWSLHFLEKGNWKLSIIGAVICVSIHHGNTIIVLNLLIFYFFYNEKPFPWIISIPIFIFLEFSMESSIVSSFVNSKLSIFDFSSFEGNYQRYIEGGVFETEAEAMVTAQRGMLTQSLTVIYYCSIIYLGCCVHKFEKKGVFIYNTMVVSLILYEPFRLSGSFSRLFLLGTALRFIPISIAFFYRKELCNENKYAFVFFYFFIAYALLFYGRFVLLSPDAAYVWSDVVK